MASPLERAQVDSVEHLDDESAAASRAALLGVVAWLIAVFFTASPVVLFGGLVVFFLLGLGLIATAATLRRRPRRHR